jgi:cholesterol oxidase
MWPGRLVAIRVSSISTCSLAKTLRSVQAENRYGALQTSCVYCAECDIGCNYQAKNTLDLNYLYQAETRYGAQIQTEHFVDRIVPVNKDRQDDPGAGGEYGYRVYYRDFVRQPRRSVGR